MSNHAVISVENLGKVYSINHRAERQRYVAMRDVLANKFKGLFHPRSRSPNRTRRKEDFWALRNVSFEIKQGEVVGIIGRNGAGKSTLLKILSRITEPSEGRVRIKGRVASLLEVGTGFHPELTGRENIFLNGAILGMSRAEISKKFHEIVAFAGVETFLDTPVKHFSSGMYVRLAFAVAAHLEPEILVVDEVLAVGDSEFQKRCLGKMHDVSRAGRTVLFVSHNMSAVKSLTHRGIVLNRGAILFNGATGTALQTYVQLTNTAAANERNWGHGAYTTIRAVRLLDAHGEPASQYFPGEDFNIEVELETDGSSGMSLEVFLCDATRARIGIASLYQFDRQTLPSRPGVYICALPLAPMWLASGSYALEVATSVANVAWDHQVDSAFEFDVPFSNPLGSLLDFKQSYGFGAFALASLRPPSFRHISRGQSDADLISDEETYTQPSPITGI